MKNQWKDSEKRELLKGHFIACFIRAQEEADRLEAECRRLEGVPGSEVEACQYRGKLDQLQQKAARYLKKYEALKSKQQDKV